MRDYVQVLVFVTIGVALLWFGYSLFFGRGTGSRGGPKSRSPKGGEKRAGVPGDAQVCPVCSSRLEKGDLVQTLAYPSITGGRDRLMHIRGCLYCLTGNLERSCPVCRGPLRVDEILVARIFDRGLRRSHVHILGCSRCRRLGVM